MRWFIIFGQTAYAYFTVEFSINCIGCYKEPQTFSTEFYTLMFVLAIEIFKTCFDLTLDSVVSAIDANG